MTFEECPIIRNKATLDILTTTPPVFYSQKMKSKIPQVILVVRAGHATLVNPIYLTFIVIGFTVFSSVYCYSKEFTAI